jgi:flagellar hook-associated protein 1 FlgK
MQQTKLAVTGNNIANADTVGYHRQTVSSTSAPAVANTNNWLGTGVQIGDVVRTYDQALERNLRQTTCQDGYYQTYAGHLGLLEGVVAPNGESAMAQAVTDFATGLSALDANPTSTSTRNSLIASGTNLADQINRTRAGLVSLRDNIANASGKGELADGVAQVNQLATQIADLNRQIAATEQRLFNPQQANDLRDRREQLMGDLSRLADVSVTEQSDGSWDLGLGGTSLVTGTTVNALAVQMNPTGPSVIWQATGTAVSQDGGKLQALLDADAYTRSSIAELDSFATTLADTLNTQHAAGFDLLGAPGGDLFDATTPGSVSFLINQPSQLAAAGTAGATADSTNARALYDAMTGAVAGLDGDSLLSRPDRLVDSIAMDTASASALAEGTAAGIDMFRDAIGQISGVNMDEEMMTMLETQRAYQASARFVGVIDDMLGETLQMIS